jgi:periplasmic protein TonB
MFNNLIESSSHAKEFKRRGSFLLFTTATYVVLFAITGVLSIYAYDARLGQQNLELVVLLPPTELAPDPQPVAPIERPRVTRDNDNQSNIPTREIAMATVDTPERPPDDVSTRPNSNLPVPKNGVYIVNGVDSNPAGPASGPGSSTGGRQAVMPRQQLEIEEPPPAAEQPKVPKIVSKGVITGQAIALPQPAYPALAKQARVQGIVSVQVLIDEQGTVISATPVGGHPMLRGSAQQAALRARFRPTLLSNQPVKVSGVITYDFKLGY